MTVVVAQPWPAGCSRLRASVALLVLGLGSACTGVVSGGSPNSYADQRGGGGASGPAGEVPLPKGGAGGESQASMPGELLPGQPADDGIEGGLRRLTTIEFRNTAVDLLGLADFNLGPTDAFLPDGRNGLFVSNLNLPTENAIAADYLTAAEAFAEERVSSNFQVLSTCAFDKTEEPCAKELIDRLGKRAWRRPLLPAEAEELMALYSATRSASGGTYQDGVRVVLTALLQSHEFLYHFEVGDNSKAEPNKGGKIPLTNYELASRLSYMFWGSMPDDELFRAADSGELQSPSGLAKQVERMMSMPRTRAGLVEFFREWLGFESANGIYNNPLYDNAKDYLRPEVDAFISSVLFDGDGKLSTLLTAPYSFINEPLAAIYGIEGIVGKDLRRQDLDPQQRSGILTMPVIMANTSFPDGGIRPVIRGKYIRQRLFCQEMPPPPPEANTMAPKVQDGATVRQRFEQHAANAFCAGCHRLLDPIGLVFDRYDATGAYRALDASKPNPDGNDDAGEVVGTDVDGTINGVAELAKKLATSKDVQACAATSWFRYALGRSGEAKTDAAPLADFIQKFTAANGDLRRLFVDLVQSDAFRYLNAPAKEACQ